MAMRYLFLDTTDCCDAEDCPHNGLIEGILVSENPDLIGKINPSLSQYIGATDDPDDILFKLPLDELINRDEVKKLLGIGWDELTKWWCDDDVNDPEPEVTN